MKLIDEQLQELEELDISTTRQPDFHDFWKDNLEQVKPTPPQLSLQDKFTNT